MSDKSKNTGMVTLTQTVTLDIEDVVLAALIRSTFGLSSKAVIGMKYVPEIKPGEIRCLSSTSAAPHRPIFTITSDSPVDVNPLNNLHSRIKTMLEGT